MLRICFKHAQSALTSDLPVTGITVSSSLSSSYETELPGRRSLCCCSMPPAVRSLQAGVKTSLQQTACDKQPASTNFIVLLHAIAGIPHAAADFQRYGSHSGHHKPASHLSKLGRGLLACGTDTEPKRQARPTRSLHTLVRVKRKSLRGQRVASLEHFASLLTAPSSDGV